MSLYFELEKKMAVVSDLKLSANEVASIIVRSGFTDDQLVAILMAVKYRQDKNKKVKSAWLFSLWEYNEPILW